MSGRARRFAIAPMSRGIRVLTGVLLAIPALFVGAGLAAPQALLLLPVGLAIAALYAGIWLWRPAAFEVSDEGLCIRFPLRSRRIAATRLAGARVLRAAELRAELGFALRVGAGGLWGGFGWLWSTRRGWVELYVSRLDGFVWIERRDGRPLLVTPVDPEGMVRALGELQAM